MQVLQVLQHVGFSGTRSVAEARSLHQTLGQRAKLYTYTVLIQYSVSHSHQMPLVLHV